MSKYTDKIRSIVDDHGLIRHNQPEEIVESIDDSLARALFEASSPANPPKEATDPKSKEGISNAVASEYFARARALATTAHFAHLSTDSFSEHSALTTFYDDIIQPVDTFCEAYIGLYGKFITLPPIVPQMQQAVDAIIEFRDWITKNRGLITDDSSLQNSIDTTVELCNTTVYKLQKLK